jgi:hypothetical protein
VPPQLKVYVQPSVFEAFEKERRLYYSQRSGAVDIPEINIESLLVHMDDLNEFGNDGSQS